MHNEAPTPPPPDGEAEGSPARGGQAQGGQAQGGQAQGGARARAWAGRLRALILDNKLFALVLAAGAVLRLIAVLGYPGALWFAGDSYVYLGAALRLRPDLSKSTGYSLMLKVLEPFHSLTLVTIVQHLMGLAIGVLLYVLLRRARVPKLVSALATVPVLLNGFQIELEHMIMADTLFMFLLVVAATILLWRPRPSWPAVLIAGLLTGYAVTVWSGGLVLPVVFVVFVIWRRMGWRPLAAIVAGSALPIVAYAAWFHSSSGTFALTRSEGFYLYGRVSSFADCSKINPPANERFLCLSTPVTKRLPPGTLVWHVPQVMDKVPGGPVSVAGNKMLRDFAIRAIEAQPVSYAHVIVNGVVLSVDWKRYNYPSQGTVYDYYFHTRPQVVPDHSWIPGATAPQDILAYGHQGISRVVKPLDDLMAGYERVFYLYGPLFGLILILGLGGVIQVRRRRAPDSGRAIAGFRLVRRRDGPSMMPWVAAIVLLVFPIAVADFDYRYVLPVIPFACLAAGLAFAPPLSRRQPSGDPAPAGAEAPVPASSAPGAPPLASD
ncbi:MAG: hypothetical protein ACLPKE_33250 [Streptosporangiaceae bacterium]